MRLNTLSVQNAGINGRSKYLDILDAAWQEHLEPRELNTPTIVSLFAGAGGSSLGYSMAGYRELLAVEWNDNAVETFKLNFPDIQVWHGDITKLSVDECLQIIGLKPGKLDVLDGSPPCQGFSISGKRQFDDLRNSLAKEFVRLLRGLQPKVFVMENVSGMVKGKMKLVFAEITKELKASGYQVKCQLMNTMYFNVPQSRQRLIWIGTRNDLGIEPSLPQAADKPYSVRDAWEGLENQQGKSLPPQARKVYQCTPIGQSLEYGARRLLNKKQYFTSRRIDPNRPINTISKSPGSIPCHPFEPRRLSRYEIGRLGTFPDLFRFSGSYIKIQNVIGNSVPPLFMKAIAKYIRDKILVKVDMTSGEPELQGIHKSEIIHR